MATAIPGCAPTPPSESTPMQSNGTRLSRPPRARQRSRPRRRPPWTRRPPHCPRMRRRASSAPAEGGSILEIAGKNTWKGGKEMNETKLSRLRVSAFVAAVILVGGLPFLAVPSRADSNWTLRDDATGGDCTLIGAWDGSTKTCTLTTDVYETIVLDSSGLTLDGNGKSISGSFSYGVYASGRSGLTVRNVSVTIDATSFAYGIYLYSSGSSTVSGNTVTASIAYQGVWG